MVTFKRVSFALSLVLALAAATTLSARADDHHHHDDHHGGPHGGPHPGFGRGGHFHDFRGRDFAHFSPADRALWIGGGWHHEWHDGRLGWWWAVGGLWYFYPAPIYPYPSYVADTVWTAPMAAGPVGPGPGYAPGYWYYCQANGAYYPNTPTCPVPWTPVAPQGQ
ncbi:MAG TPA: hypothetical protein VH020_06825 [Stellaceae bacterium]|nr:hypothetical protein [Stellaceae bacterium]